MRRCHVQPETANRARHGWTEVAHPVGGAPGACEPSQAEADEVALPSYGRRFVTCAARWVRPTNSFSVDSSLRGAEGTRSMERHEGAGSNARLRDFVSTFAVSR